MDVTRRRRRASWSVLLVAFVAVAACSGGASAPSSSYSVVGSLRQIPASAVQDPQNITLVSGDLDRATKLAGLTRPGAGATGATIATWVTGISGVNPSSKVVLLLATAFDPTNIGDVAAFGDALGWSALDVSTYSELESAPQNMAVMTGSFDRKKIDAAQGDQTGGVWSLGGDDFSINGQPAPGRPLGQALRTASKGGRLAEARSTPPLKDWLAGAKSLSDDPGLMAVGAALDAAKVYGAIVVRLSFTPDSQRPAAQADALTTLKPFDTLGAGMTLDGGDAVVVLAYHSADAQDAKDNAALLRTLFTDDVSMRTGEDWSKLVHVDAVRADGHLAIVTLHVLAGAPPAIIYQGMVAGETFAAHG